MDRTPTEETLVGGFWFEFRDADYIFWRYRITGLVHRPFKAEIRVRVPLALLSFSDVAQLVEQGFRKAQVVSSSLTVGVRKHLAKCPSLRARPVSFGYRWTGGVMKPAMKW